jgi:hypothetical protein
LRKAPITDDRHDESHAESGWAAVRAGAATDARNADARRIG